MEHQKKDNVLFNFFYIVVCKWIDNFNIESLFLLPYLDEYDFFLGGDSHPASGHGQNSPNTNPQTQFLETVCSGIIYTIIFCQNWGKINNTYGIGTFIKETIIASCHTAGPNWCGIH